VKIEFKDEYNRLFSYEDETIGGKTKSSMTFSSLLQMTNESNLSI